MTQPSTRALLLTSAVLIALAVTAAPAHATFTPVSTAYSMSSVDSQLSDENGNITRCPLADATGTNAADGRSISLRLSFRRAAATTCTSRTGLGTFSVTYTCSGSVTLRSTASTAGVSATFDIALDSDFRCSVEKTGIPIIGSCTTDLQGPQGPFRSAGTLTQRTQRISVSLTPLALRTNCPGDGIRGTFTGTYLINSPRFTIS